MLQNTITRSRAMEIIKDLQLQGYARDDIRKHIMDKGFSWTEFEDMMGEAARASFGNKPKNKLHSKTHEFERGGCLSAYLVFSAAVTIFVTGSVFVLANDAAGLSGGFMFVVLIVGTLAGLQLLCIGGLWHGKKWGFQGLVALLGISAVLNGITVNLPQLAGNIIAIGIA